MSGLKMPGKGKAALLLSELNAEHAPKPEEPNRLSEETNVTTLQETNETTHEGSHDDGSEPSNEHSQPPMGERDNRPGRTRRERAPKRGVDAAPPDGREERFARALQSAAEDEITVVTVRVSARLNEYMDRYVERLNRIHPKRRYRKQDAVAEAFAAFFADHPLPPAPTEEEL